MRSARIETRKNGLSLERAALFFNNNEQRPRVNGRKRLDR